MSFERERVHSCEKAVGRVTESVRGECACRGVAWWAPSASRGAARGRNANSAVWPVRNRLSAAQTSETLYPTVYGPCQKQTLHTHFSTNISVAYSDLSWILDSYTVYSTGLCDLDISWRVIWRLGRTVCVLYRLQYGTQPRMSECNVIK